MRTGYKPFFWGGGSLLEPLFGGAVAWLLVRSVTPLNLRPPTHAFLLPSGFRVENVST